MLNFLAGKKTYIVVLLMLAIVAVEKFLGLDIPGVTVTDEWMKITLEALGLGALRASIGKK